mmetsp:Transcript_14454/g.24677  ORF Transcript_14454/g.24677 Transcript_14454/m.24677 type:complete len:98 (+) Transcript_14454:1207-1500(+)
MLQLTSTASSDPANGQAAPVRKEFMVDSPFANFWLEDTFRTNERLKWSPPKETERKAEKKEASGAVSLLMPALAILGVAVVLSSLKTFSFVNKEMFG